ncbi:MAG TPA: response regulator [Candidatus Thermoplasmatota archaeon]|nr:response regulator [Candidatus Thermoplasmatota archaeon]
MDDEQGILRSTCALLHALGYLAVPCADAGSIRAAIERERPDLVLQDVRMPGLDLESLVLDVRRDARFRALPFVVFTASMDVDGIVERVQASGLLDKPFSPQELRAAIDAALGRAPAATA